MTQGTQGTQATQATQMKQLAQRADRRRTADVGATLAGHRVIRRIGIGRRSEVFLGRIAEGRVAVKVFGPAADPDAISREVRALLNTAPATLVSLRDVASTPDGRVCLVVDYLPGMSLARLLTARGQLDAGEIVTIAATVTAALQVLHEAGLSLPLVRPAGVRFDGRGRPVLLGLGALVDLQSGAAGVMQRRDALVALAGFLRQLMAFLDPADARASTAPALLTEFEAASAARPFPSSLVGLEGALFAWAPAAAVRGAVPGVPAVPGAVSAPPVARETPTTREAGWATVRVRAPERPRTVLRSLVSRVPLAAPESLQGLARVGRRSTDWMRSVGRRLSDRAVRRRIPRRPVLLGIGLMMALVVGGLVALSSAAPATEAGPTHPNAGDNVDTAPVDGPGTDSPGPDEGAPGDADVIRGDDPVAAALVLLRHRATCLAEASVLCLDDVDQPGSVLMSADGHRIRQLQSAPGAAPVLEEPDVPRQAELRERTGNAALVGWNSTAAAGANAQPASALMIKGEAGWRLREIFDY